MTPLRIGVPSRQWTTPHGQVPTSDACHSGGPRGASTDRPPSRGAGRRDRSHDRHADGSAPAPLKAPLMAPSEVRAPTSSPRSVWRASSGQRGEPATPTGAPSGRAVRTRTSPAAAGAPEPAPAASSADPRGSGSSPPSTRMRSQRCQNPDELQSVENKGTRSIPASRPRSHVAGPGPGATAPAPSCSSHCPLHRRCIARLAAQPPTRVSTSSPTTAPWRLVSASSLVGPIRDDVAPRLRHARGGGAPPDVEVLELDDAGGLVPSPSQFTWAEHLQRVFAVDVLRCPRCGDRRRAIAGDPLRNDPLGRFDARAKLAHRG